MTGMMAIHWDPAGPLDPANSVADRGMAADFRSLRDGSGRWAAFRMPALPYSTFNGGQRSDWAIDIWDGPGRMISDRLGSPIIGYAFHGKQLEALADSFSGVPWTPWVAEKYPYVTEAFYRELGEFLAICVRHCLAVSFASG